MSPLTSFFLRLRSEDNHRSRFIAVTDVLLLDMPRRRWLRPECRCTRPGVPLEAAGVPLNETSMPLVTLPRVLTAFLDMARVASTPQWTPLRVLPLALVPPRIPLSVLTRGFSPALPHRCCMRMLPHPQPETHLCHLLHRCDGCHRRRLRPSSASALVAAADANARS